MDLNKIKLAHSPLTDRIYLFRHGKDAGLALDKREAEADVFGALVKYMMHDSPNGSKKVVSIGGEWFEITVKPATEVER